MHGVCEVNDDYALGRCQNEEVRGAWVKMGVVDNERTGEIYPYICTCRRGQLMLTELF